MKTVNEDRPSLPSPITEVSTPVSVQTVVHVPIEQRIPSLTRTEASEQDTSRGATTPEAPPRVLQPGVLTPRQTQDGSEYVLEGEEREDWSEPAEALGQGFDGDADLGTPRSQGYAASPDKTASHAGTPRRYETPQPEDSFQTASADSPGGALLRNIAAAAVQSPISAPYTPCPPGMASKSSDVNSTPRAPLNDAERRKNHVLAVLSSTGIPQRAYRTSIGATPHPLRRVMNATGSDDDSSPYRSGTLHAVTPSPRAVSAVDMTSASQFIEESFVSIASSADLTSDKRASRLHHGRASWVNTSVPNLLLPNASAASAGSLKGLSDHRVDGVKIHKHLNAMNKQLLETNSDLAREAEAWRDEAERLKAALQDNGIEVEAVDVMAAVRAEGGSLNGRAAQGYRSPQSAAGESREEIAGDISQGTQVAMLQDMADRLEELAAGIEERDQRIAELEGQVALHDRPVSSDSTLGRHVEELAQQLDESEQARADMQADFAKKTAEHAAKFGDICTAFEGQVKGLERELAQVKADTQKLKDNKARLEDLLSMGSAGEKEREWRRQISDLELELRRTRDEVKARSDENEALRQDGAVRQNLSDNESDKHALDEARTRLGEVEQDLADAQERERAVRAERDELYAQLERKEGVNVTDLRQTIDQQAVELDNQQADLKMMFETEQALRAQLAALSTRPSSEDRITELAAELDRVHQQLEERTDALAETEGKIAELEVALEAANSRPTTTPAADDSVLSTLQDRLDEAYHEIGRLKQELAATPHRKSGLEIRDTRIKALEREKAALADRLAAARPSSSPSVSMLQSAGSPFRSTTLVHKAIAGLRDPKTPGPMHELSWLQSTIGNADEPILKAQIDFLQHELTNANKQLDSNFDRLEAAGFGGLELAERLASAQDKIAELEDQIRALSQRNHAATALVSAQRTASDKDGEKKTQRALEAVNKEMDKLRADMGSERKRLSKDNERLRDLVEDVRSKAEAESARLVSEMERLARTSEKELRETERGLASVARERDAARKVSVLLRVRKQADERQELQLAIDAIQRLESELREAPRQRQPSDSETVRKLEMTLREAVGSAERLRGQLDNKEAALVRAETTIAKLRSERQVIAKTLEGFERDMDLHRKASRDFGIELQMLKAERATGSGRDGEMARLERECRALHQQLEEAEASVREKQNKLWGLQKWKDGHVCDDASVALEGQKEHFKTQAKELGAQIRYLKAKYVRENTFREGLSLQKTYMLLMVGGMSLR